MSDTTERTDPSAPEVRPAARTRPAMLLFVIQEVAHFASLYPIAAMLKKSGRYGAVFMFHTVYDAREKDMETCEENGMIPVATWARPVPRKPRWQWLRRCHAELRRRLGLRRRLRYLARRVRLVQSYGSVVVGRWRRRILSVWLPVRRRAGRVKRAVRGFAGRNKRAARRVAGRIKRGVLRRRRDLRAWVRQSVRGVYGFRLRRRRAIRRLQRRTIGGLLGVWQIVPRETRYNLRVVLRRTVRRTRRPARLPYLVARLLVIRTLAVPVFVLLRLFGIARTTSRLALQSIAACWRGLLWSCRACPGAFRRSLGLAGSSSAWLAWAVLRGVWHLLFPVRFVLRPFLQRSRFLRLVVGVKSLLSDRRPLGGRLRPRDATATFRRFTMFLRQIRDVCEDHDVRGVVLAEDNVGHGTGAFSRVARERGAPLFVFPYTVANAREFAESYFEVPEHQAALGPNVWIAWLLPHWVHEHRGKRLMRLPGWNCVAQECLRMAPPNPWAYNSGYADAIVVENEILVDYYRKAGLKHEPLYAAGALFDDQLAETLRNRDALRAELYEELGLPADRPMVLCALPPNQIPSRPHCGFETFEAMARAFTAPLLDVGTFNVVVKLHPRIRRADVEFLEELGFAISDADTAALVPLCDLYVASVSATIRWAVACGRPVVNYDVYRYQYDDYDAAPGVATIEEFKEYGRLVQRLTTEPLALAELTRRQVTCMERWGRLDGLAGERILTLVDEAFGHLPAATTNAVLAIGANAHDATRDDANGHDTGPVHGGADDARSGHRNGTDGTPAPAGRRATAA